MKKIILLFVVIAAAFVAAMASPMLVPVNVTANPAVCTIDGTCDQVGSNVCQISSGGTTIVFFIVGGVHCGSVAATGKFSL